MIIFQPRRDNISEYAISKEELLRWANEILTPTAQLAANGDGDFKAEETLSLLQGQSDLSKTSRI